MPVTASIAPSTPRTPKETVAVRAAKSALSSSFCQVISVMGKPASRPRKVSCKGAARFWASPLPRTTNQVAVAGDWRRGRKKAGRWSSVSVLYFPSSTTPATWILTPSSVLKYPPIAWATEPKTSRANSRLTTATLGAFLSSRRLNVLPASSVVADAWK